MLDISSMTEKEFLEQNKSVQDVTQTGAVKVTPLKIPFKKPDPGNFFRVHPGEEYTITLTTFKPKTDGVSETYVLFDARVAQIMLADFPQLCRVENVYTTLTRQGSIYLWPVPQGDNDYWQTAREIIEFAKQEWVAYVTNKERGCYDKYVPANPSVFPEPDWPGTSFFQLLQTALKDKCITDLNHEALKQLRGEVF